MRVGTVLKGVHVRLDRFEVHSHGGRLVQEHLRLVNPLRSRRNLLSTEEQVVGIRPAVILGIRHGVERTNGLGKLVNDIELLTKLLLDHRTKNLLVLRADVLLIIVNFHTLQVRLEDLLLVIIRGSLQLLFHNGRALFPEQLNGLGILQLQARVLPLQILEGVLLANRLPLGSELRAQALKDVVEQTVQDIQDLGIVVLEGHLKIQAGEFGHVTMRH
mmetsp:Transcript_19619/g.52283  ORF Transcript_19619/g.52283 Transcript_19619/m.52283 type:complete len:217 (-) Transcript_19619:1554-2204(-)